MIINMKGNRLLSYCQLIQLVNRIGKNSSQIFSVNQITIQAQMMETSEIRAVRVLFCTCFLLTATSTDIPREQVKTSHPSILLGSSVDSNHPTQRQWMIHAVSSNGVSLTRTSLTGRARYWNSYSWNSNSWNSYSWNSYSWTSYSWTSYSWTSYFWNSSICLQSSWSWLLWWSWHCDVL